MKKAILILGILAITAAGLFAQTEGSDKSEDKEIKTLLGENVSHGGYGAIMVNYTVIDDKDAILVGGKGAWIINHVLGIGIGGYGFANDLTFDNVLDEKGYSLAGGYGGLLIEPVILPHSPVHIAVPILVGAGGVALLDSYYYSYDEPQSYYAAASDAFFVVEPGIEIEFNMVKFMRLSLGVYYRYTQDLELPGLDANTLNGFSGGLGLKFGKF